MAEKQIIIVKDRSPFFPGKPVTPEFFIGREEQVKLLERAIRQAKSGNPQYVFITGERGIGKSSLVSLAGQLAERVHGFITAQCQLGGVDSVGEACRRMYQAIVSQLPEKTLFDKVRGVFDKYVEKIDLFGIGVEFKKDAESRESLVENFLPLLFRVGQVIREAGKSGIFLAADDLNGIADDTQFAHFLKSMVDQIAVGPQRNFPWVFSLVGIPQRMDDLKAKQPSIDRIFQPIELNIMREKDAIAFFEQSFRSVEHTWDTEALELMAKLAGGHPVMWHEMGDAVFWEDQDGHIDIFDVSDRGLSVACENVGRKYLARPLYEELRSQVYQDILQHIGRLSYPIITRADVLKSLSPKQAKNFDNFIKKMRKIGVLKNVPGTKGEYEFVNFLYFFYITLRARAGKSEEIIQQLERGA
ncbi:MAG: ATP-binding protein [Phycisphaerae bacterium]|nr:ATP-binding protein [Phycisphaerae bacterium]